MNIQGKIPEPCHEHWDKMKIGLRSRHCVHCSKNVMDFTKMDREEILAYLLQNRASDTCGRIRPSQLDFTINDLEVAVNRLSKKSANRNLAFYLLTLGCLVLSGCNTDVIDPMDSKAQTEVNSHTSVDSTATGDTTGWTELEEVPMTGMIAIPDLDELDGEGNKASDQVELISVYSEMPEFPGGAEAMHQYIRKNFRYPETSLDYEGRIYVSFVVGETGELTDINVVKGLSPSMNKAAIEVVKGMPTWTPGKQDGQTIPVRMFIPVNIAL